jgi:hypothetical protein
MVEKIYLGRFHCVANGGQPADTKVRQSCVILSRGGSTGGVQGGGYSLEENSGIPFLSCEATSNIILKRLIFEYTRFSNTQDLASSARRDAGFPWGGA